MHTNNKNILVVDDNALICLLIQKIMGVLGLRVRAVANGTDALSEIRTVPYNAIFLDIHLPDANGLNVLKDIRVISPETKVVIMTGSSARANRENALSNGACYFLEKPFTIGEVKDIVHSIFPS